MKITYFFTPEFPIGNNKGFGFRAKVGCTLCTITFEPILFRIWLTPQDFPQEILDAQCLIAYNLVMNPEMITGSPGGGGDGAAAGTYVSEQTLGTMSIKYAAYPSGESGSDSCVDCSTPDVIAKLPWLKGVLSCWADVSTGGSKVLLRVRS